MKAEACLVSVLGRVCPLDHVKCCFEITSCSESQSVLNLLTRRTSFESLMGNIKYHCWPWTDALRGADVRSSRLRGQQGALCPTEEEDWCPGGGKPVGGQWVGLSWVCFGLSESSRGSAQGPPPHPPHLPTAFLV